MKAVSWLRLVLSPGLGVDVRAGAVEAGRACWTLRVVASEKSLRKELSWDARDMAAVWVL